MKIVIKNINIDLRNFRFPENIRENIYTKIIKPLSAYRLCCVYERIKTEIHQNNSNLLGNGKPNFPGSLIIYCYY